MHLAFTNDLSLGATPTKKLNHTIPLLKYCRSPEILQKIFRTGYFVLHAITAIFAILLHIELSIFYFIIASHNCHAAYCIAKANMTS